MICGLLNATIEEKVHVFVDSENSIFLDFYS